tara:strand:+ start:4569 stop:4775 length:207 start_codon:yes stop_codon:yes gene_type:complete
VIKVEKNYSFLGWFKIYFSGVLIDEVLGSETALECALNIARENEMHYIYFIDDIIDVENTPSLILAQN